MKLTGTVRNLVLGVASIATLGLSVSPPQKTLRKYASLVGTRGLWNDFVRATVGIAESIKEKDA